MYPQYVKLELFNFHLICFLLQFDHHIGENGEEGHEDHLGTEEDASTGGWGGLGG